MALSIDTLKIADFRMLLGTRLAVMMAMQAQAVIVGWQVYSITKDPLMLGLVGLFEALPAIISALFSGHIVDTHRPYRIYTLALSSLALSTGAMWLVGGGHVGAGDQTIVYCLFAGVFVSGIARSFGMPSSYSLLSQIVPRDKISAAAAWLSSGFQVAAITGPALAGLIYAGYGAGIAWWLPLSLMLCSLVLLSQFNQHPRRYLSQAKKEKALQSIRAGWVFMRNTPALLPSMALDMFAVLFGGAVAILPAFATEVLGADAQELGLLRAAPAIGAIITSLALALYPLKTIRSTTLLIAVTGFGISIIGFGLSTTFANAMFFLAVAGAFDSVSMVIRSSLIQLLTPDAMRGRVTAVNTMFITSSNEIGAFESGLAAHVMGLVPSILFGGGMTLAIVAFTALCFPQFRRTAIRADDHSP
jgi:MFS family permease